MTTLLLLKFCSSEAGVFPSQFFHCQRQHRKRAHQVGPLIRHCNVYPVIRSQTASLAVLNESMLSFITNPYISRIWEIDWLIANEPFLTSCRYKRTMYVEKTSLYTEIKIQTSPKYITSNLSPPTNETIATKRHTHKFNLNYIMGATQSIISTENCGS